MPIDNGLLFAKGQTELRILPNMANRHGLIAGATGTGKTVSLKVLCEKFSSIGVPVFLSDIKGDLSGTCKPGAPDAKIEDRVKSLGLDDFQFTGFPVTFWDVFGQQGHPVRTTISEMGPLLLSKLLNLNEVQSGVLNIVFKIADDSGMLLLDLKDLRSMLSYVGDHAKEYTTDYGTVTKQSIGAIQRGLLALEQQGGDRFFGEPSLDIRDFMRTDSNGKGMVNILASDKLYQLPELYSTFMLWLLSELFEELPEVGDTEKPKIIFFFDEAHLLFNGASKVLLQKVEHVVRLIRSKGVGVYFVTQNPADIPATVLGQLGNRVQHAMRAFTPKEQAAVRTAAQTFRANPAFSVETAITELAVGEALVSFLDEKGIPSMVERALVLPPQSHIGPVSPEERDNIIRQSIHYGRYEQTVDRFSAFEAIQQKAQQAEAEKRAREERLAYEKQMKQAEAGRYGGDYGSGYRRGTTSRSSSSSSILSSMAKSAMTSIGRTVGRELVRGVLGSLLRK
ncbi:MAG: helicase HerA-like domain-containing protein [Acetivibrionales bacterium]